MVGELKAKLVEIGENVKKIGEDDPRRIIHSMKVGLALTLVSLFYYFRPLYDRFGQAGIWAILTVAVVFEFTVGETLSKSLNRGFATLVAGVLGVGAVSLAHLCGDKGQPIVLGIMVFVLVTLSTFIRFFPYVKRRFDYGVVIFILTFSLVAVSGVRVTDILKLAYQRLATILIGGATCMIISIFVCPVWAGLDLHNLIASNIEKLAAFLQGFGDEEDIRVSSDAKSNLEAYKSVLHSKATEESLANLAWWEPRHGEFKFHHPWKLYLKTGVLVRECAYKIEELNGFINSKTQQPCSKMSKECSKTLMELASAIRNMRFPTSSVETHTKNSKSTTEELKKALGSSSVKADIQEILPPLVIASVLVDVLECVDEISASVHELSQEANFHKEKWTTPARRGVVNPVSSFEGTETGVQFELPINKSNI